MIIDTVDFTDTPVGVTNRADVFREHASFRVAHVFIFNSRGEILLQKLAKTRRRNPGSWGSSVAAYLFSSESYEHAANRRTREELGIPNCWLYPLGKTEMIDEGCLKFIALFKGIYDGPFHLDPSHIDEVAFSPFHTVCQLAESSKGMFTPTFLRVLEYYQSLRLS